MAQEYRRIIEPALRGWVGTVLTVAVFAAGGAIGGRPGVAVAAAGTAVGSSYCLLNFWHCRETHCAVTGPGWSLAAMLGFAAALVPGPSLAWYRITTAAIAFVVVLAAGYGLEWVVAARTGRHSLGRGGHAQDH